MKPIFATFFVLFLFFVFLFIMSGSYKKIWPRNISSCIEQWVSYSKHTDEFTIYTEYSEEKEKGFIIGGGIQIGIKRSCAEKEIDSVMKEEKKKIEELIRKEKLVYKYQ